MAFPGEGEPDEVFHVDASTPLFLDLPGRQYDTPPQGGLRHAKDPAAKTGNHFKRFQGFSVQLPHVVLNTLWPPIVFTYVSATLSFGEHFRFPRFVWVLALPGLIPVFIA